MPIHPLPASCISSLTATQVLAYPPSLIKELVENAIDANATLISVELATNCLDMLQVKDNGHGVLPGGDRDSLCRRGWTSKISDWEEIGRWKGSAVDNYSCADGGGGTLGFRGEALAAAAEMAGGGVEVLTRVEGEKVGWVGTYSRAGELTSTNVKPIPIGTTVKVIDFLKNFPVRRETAKKSAAKHVLQIRRLLIAYALSHPQIRFSIKVLPTKPKAKPSADDNWVYCPSKTVQEAVMKIFGKEILGGSLWAERVCGKDDIEGKAEIEVCMLRPGLDPSQLMRGKAAFISPMNFIFVDSRPISCSRPGPFKSLLSLYKTYLRSALSTSCTYDTIPPVSDPFIYLNIRCKMPGMYDPNIEPAKDDVLFHSWEGDVLTVVEGLFREVYGELRTKEKPEKVKRPLGIGKVDFGVLLAQKPVHFLSELAPSPAPTVEGSTVTNQVTKSSEIEIQEDIDEYPDSEFDHWDGSTPPITDPADPAIPVPNHSTEEASNAGKRRPTWGFSMSENLVEDEVEDHLGAEYLSNPHTPPSEIGASRKDITLSNPWVMAKLNTSVIQHSSPQRVPVVPVVPRSSGRVGLGKAGGGGMGEHRISHRQSIYSKTKGSRVVGGDGESSTAPQKLRGLGKWVISTSAKGGELQASVGSFPEASSPPHAPGGKRTADAVRGNGPVAGSSTGEFMTATDFMVANMESDSGGIIGVTSYSRRFAGVDGPGGVIVRSREEKHISPSHRALWPNLLERRPLPQQDGDDGDDSDDQSLSGSLSFVAKRRRLDKGKGKTRAYQCDFQEVDEQLDFLFTHPPLNPQLPQRGQVQMSAGVRPQKRFVPLLHQVTTSSNSDIRYPQEQGQEVEHEADEAGEEETLSEKPLLSGTAPLLTRSPHNNRRRAATAALSVPGKNNLGMVTDIKGFENLSSRIDASDTQAQPTRPAKPRRKPRHLLPLERVAAEDRVHNTLVTIQFYRSVLSSTDSAFSGVVAEQNFATFVTRVIQWNLNEYTSQGKWGGAGKESTFCGEWIGMVLNEWLRARVAERERGGIGGMWIRERELLGRIAGWVEKNKQGGGQEGEGEGEGEGEEEGGGGMEREEEKVNGKKAVGIRVDFAVRRLWAVWE